MDETPVQVLKEQDKRVQSKSYIWLQRGRPPTRPVILYDYDPGRSAQVPKRLLEDFRKPMVMTATVRFNDAAKHKGITRNAVRRIWAYR